MAQDRLVPPTISVLGFAVLIIGSMGYMGVYAVNDAVSYTMMIIGIMAVIIGMLLMYRYDPYEHATRGGKDMGFIDKLKNAFKKKNKGEAAAAEPAAKKTKGAAANRAAEFKGEGKVGDALRFAAEKIDNPRYAGEYPTDFAYCRHILLENGVPESTILREDRSTNTGENAEFSAQVLRELGIQVKKAILCCQSFHARRAFMTYAKYFPETEILVVPTDTQGIRREVWSIRESSYRRVMSELYKCGEYFLDYVEN